MSQFVYDLIDDGLGSLHFHFGIAALSLDPVAHHAEGITANKVQKIEGRVTLRREIHAGNLSAGSEINSLTLKNGARSLVEHL